MTISDWDDAYANAPHIPGGADYPGRWAEKAAAFRALVPPRVLAYGPHPRERLDLFLPDGEARGLVVFVHGGYWRAFDRSHWSHLAAGAARPRLGGGAALLRAHARGAHRGHHRGDRPRHRGRRRAVAGPIRLAGHSAGGHLVTRQVCTDTGLAAGTAERPHRARRLDQRPARPAPAPAHRAQRQTSTSTLEEARAESPALREPREGVRLTAWVGAAERPEFLRQSALIANVWTGLGAATPRPSSPTATTST
jgi:arylformamidase